MVQQFALLPETQAQIQINFSLDWIQVIHA